MDHTIELFTEVEKLRKQMKVGIARHLIAVIDLQQRFEAALAGGGFQKDQMVKPDSAGGIFLNVKILEILNECASRMRKPEHQPIEKALAETLFRGFTLGVFLSEMGAASFMLNTEKKRAIIDAAAKGEVSWSGMNSAD